MKVEYPNSSIVVFTVLETNRSPLHEGGMPETNGWTEGGVATAPVEAGTSTILNITIETTTRGRSPFYMKEEHPNSS
jgi:hypothetical protein